MNLIKWLINGDISVEFQTKRDLLGETDYILKKNISKEGYGKLFIDNQKESSHFGNGFYSPKWTSTHYTLLDLKNLNMDVTYNVKKVIINILEELKAEDGGINPAGSITVSDVCINGMLLNYMCYFGVNKKEIESIIDFIINQQMVDGGFNCRKNRSGTKHSSLHSTISVLEGIQTYKIKGYTYRLDKLLKIEKEGIEFILQHNLYKSDRTGQIIKKSFTMLSYPYRWKYDILRSLDYLREAKVKYDSRMEDALILLISKVRKDGTWPVQNKHPGKVHFDMEEVGSSSYWNTLRALRVLKYYKFDYLLNEVLFKVNKLFSENSIRFGIGASLLLRSFNLTSKVSDIDIIIHDEDVEKVIEIMNTIGIRRVSKELTLYETESFLEYNVDGIDLDIMSKFSVRTDEGVFLYPFDVKELKYKVVLNCSKIPVLSLENWFVSYLVINRKEKAEIIKKYLKETGFNELLLKNALKLEISISIRNEINNLLKCNKEKL